AGPREGDEVVRGEEVGERSPEDEGGAGHYSEQRSVRNEPRDLERARSRAGVGHRAAQHSIGVPPTGRTARPGILTEAWTSVTRPLDAFPSSVSRHETSRRNPGGSLKLLGLGRAVDRSRRSLP